MSDVDKVIDGHGPTVHDWAAFRSYAAFTGALADAARRSETPEQALALLERNAATRPFVDDAVLPGARQRALNALNAALAVVRWKKLFGFYVDLEREHHCTYTVDGNAMTNEEKI